MPHLTVAFDVLEAPVEQTNVISVCVLLAFLRDIKGSIETWSPRMM